jgi:hypothetical protein
LLFALICCRGYKWVIEGARSQVSVVWEPSVKVEEEENERERENSSREEKGEVKRIQSLPPRKDPRPPFYKTRGQVSWVERERERAHIVKKGVQGKILPHGAGPDVLGPRSLHDGLCTFPRKWPRQWVLLTPGTCMVSVEPKTPRGGIELVGGGWWVCTWGNDLDLWLFSLTKMIPRSH